MQLCFCLYVYVHFLTRQLNRIDNDNVRDEPHTRARRPAEFKRGMHPTNNDILWFGSERRVITYLLVLMHANTRNKFRNPCEQKYCCGMENRCIGKRKVDTRLKLAQCELFTRRRNVNWLEQQSLTSWWFARDSNLSKNNICCNVNCQTHQISRSVTFETSTLTFHL